jgi:hypothetical protein
MPFEIGALSAVVDGIEKSKFVPAWSTLGGLAKSVGEQHCRSGRSGRGPSCCGFVLLVQQQPCDGWRKDSCFPKDGVVQHHPGGNVRTNVVQKANTLILSALMILLYVCRRD